MKTSELIGPALDWAVAKCEWVPWTFEIATLGEVVQDCHYSTNWSQGGPIIEREGIITLYLYVTDYPFRWAAKQKPTIKKVKPKSVYGPTPLIAAMRCYVASKLGDTIELPEELK